MIPTQRRPKKSPGELCCCLAWRARKDDLLTAMAFLDASGIPGGSRILGCRASIVTKFSPICADSHAFQSGRKTTKKIVSMTEKCPKNRNRGLMTAIAVIQPL